MIRSSFRQRARGAVFARYVLPAGETAASEKAEVEGENWAETRLVTPRSLADRFRARVEYFPAATEMEIKSSQGLNPGGKFLA